MGPGGALVMGRFVGGEVGAGQGNRGLAAVSLPTCCLLSGKLLPHTRSPFPGPLTARPGVGG